MQVLSDAPPTLETAELLAAVMPRLNRTFRGQLRPSTGLSMPQFITLRALRHGPLSAGALAQRFGVSRPTITRMVDGLVKKRLVERHSGTDDRRIAMTSLTAQGQALHEATDAAATRALAGLLAGLSPERLARLHVALGDLADLLDASDSNGAKAPFYERLTRDQS